MRRTIAQTLRPIASQTLSLRAVEGASRTSREKRSRWRAVVTWKNYGARRAIGQQRVGRAMRLRQKKSKSIGPRRGKTVNEKKEGSVVE
jgi:hypothetical protein